MSNEPIEEIFLITTKEAAEALQIPERHIWELLADGELSSIRIAGVRRIELAEVKRYIQQKADDTFRMEFGALQLRLLDLEEQDAAKAAQQATATP